MTQPTSSNLQPRCLYSSHSGMQSSSHLMPRWKNDCVSIIISILKNYKLDLFQGTSSPTRTMLLGNPCITFHTWEEPWNQREITRKTTSFGKTTVIIWHDETYWAMFSPSVLQLCQPISGHPSLQLLPGDTLILYCRSHDDSSYTRKLLRNQGSNNIEKKSTSQFEFFSFSAKHLLPERISRNPNPRYQPWRNSKANCFMERRI